MKIYSQLLTLFLLQASSDAFTVQSQGKASVTLGASVESAWENSVTPATRPQSSDAPTSMPPKDDIWKTSPTVTIQGGSLRTYPVDPMNERVHLSMKSSGRPLNANVELWHGPDYTASRMGIYIEDGNLRPLNAVVETPKGMNTIGMYNTGSSEFAFDACVAGENETGPGGLPAASKAIMETSAPTLVQGGSITSFPFSPKVKSVQIKLKTDGRNIKARIELMQGPNNDKQIFEYYAQDGKKRPFYAVIESPGSGNVVRLTNENPVEFPLFAWVEPYEIDENYDEFEPVIN